MIKTPITQHSMFTSSFVDSYGCFLDDKQLKEVAKRINLHEELVAAVEMLIPSFIREPYTEDDGKKIMYLYELLERCK